MEEIFSQKNDAVKIDGIIIIIILNAQFFSIMFKFKNDNVIKRVE